MGGAPTGEFTETGLPPMWLLAWNANTLLDDGRVLIKGSYSEGRDAAVWDPATGTFTETILSVAGGGGRATLLDDGRVFVMGGTGAEVWDPESGTFTPLDAVSGLEHHQAAVALDGGRVLVLGPEVLRTRLPLRRGDRDVDAATVTAAGAPTRRQNPRTGGCGVTAATPLLDGRILVTTWRTRPGEGVHVGPDERTVHARGQAPSREKCVLRDAPARWPGAHRRRRLSVDDATD